MNITLTNNWFCLVLTAMTLSAAVCHGDPVSSSVDDVQSPAAYQDAIKSAYDQMADGFATNHLERGAALMADDYREVDAQGNVLDKQGSMKKLHDKRQQVRTIQTKSSIASMTKLPDGVHVDITTYSNGTGIKRVLFATFKGTFTDELHVRDVWVDTSSGWKLTHRTVIKDNLRTNVR